MRYDDESSAFIIDDDFARPAKFFVTESFQYPPGVLGGGSQETRIFRCTFENRWSLSIIWGSMTYSTNYNHPWDYRGGNRVMQKFYDEPTTVEVGVIMPEPSTRIGLGGEISYELWGDPVGYVDAAGLRFLVGEVSRFNSHEWSEPDDGPYIEKDENGEYRLMVSVDFGQE